MSDLADLRDVLDDDGHELPTLLPRDGAAHRVAAAFYPDELRRPCETCGHRYKDHEDTWVRHDFHHVTCHVLCQVCDCDDFQGMTDWNGED